MKRVFIACALIAIVCVICSIGSWYLQNTYKVIDGMLDEVLKYYEQDDMQKAAEAAVDLEKEWVKRERYLSFFIDHQKVDEIGISITRLQTLALSKDYSDLLTECKLAKIMLLHVVNDEKVSIQSVL
ncbi:MAG TPA: DUF4363 family protein [Clostridiales bacterium]|nr:DUF4363 family protein [Clostridiales bacterium]